MLADLPRPLYTVVDEADADLTSNWERAGFTIGRREWEYVVPTGLGSVSPPGGVTIVALGGAAEKPLRQLDRVIRDEVEATVGWQTMPAEVLPHPVLDLSKYAVAAQHDRYVGLVRLAMVTRQPRIGLIAVRADQQRRGIGMALLAEVLGSLHRRGIETATAEVHEANAAATALFDGVGARRASSNLELVRR
jgi:ribosomal protein S18 acetylase RimI-like enzyme